MLRKIGDPLADRGLKELSISARVDVEFQHYVYMWCDEHDITPSD